MTSDTYHGCFACGQDNPHGLKLTFELDRESHASRATVTLPAHTAGWPGVAHGGIVSTLLDEAMVYACRTTGTGEIAATASLSVRFRKPAPTERVLTLEGRVLRRKRRTVTAEARLLLGETVLAEGNATLLAMPHDQGTRLAPPS